MAEDTSRLEDTEREPAMVVRSHPANSLRACALLQVVSYSAAMKSSHSERTVFPDAYFVGSAAAAFVVIGLLASFAPPHVQAGALGALVAMLVGLVVSLLQNQVQMSRDKRQFLQSIRLPLALASGHELFGHYISLMASLERIGQQPDPLFRELAILKLGGFGKQIEAISNGHFVFYETETWRTAYATLLNTATTKTYYSASWVTSACYWVHEPGRQSMQVNFRLVRRGYWIERTIILAEDLWPAHEHLPVDDIRAWIDEQHTQGVFIRLVRAADLEDERDLPSDFGIYGNRAVGEQVLDEDSRTVSFHLSFGEQRLREALDRWQRLNLFAAEYRGLLNRLPIG